MHRRQRPREAINSVRFLVHFGRRVVDVVLLDVAVRKRAEDLRADRFCYINLEGRIASQGLVESDENVVATIPSDAAVRRLRGHDLYFRLVARDEALDGLEGRGVVGDGDVDSFWRLQELGRASLECLRRRAAIVGPWFSC